MQAWVIAGIDYVYTEASFFQLFPSFLLIFWIVGVCLE